MLVKKARPLPVECIVRGYITGSGWKEYKQTGSLSGLKLQDDLKESQKLSKPIFTPSTKAEIGKHDENISFENMCDLIGWKLSEDIKEISLCIYETAHEFAIKKGIIIADTKFEFGIDIKNNELLLIDELLTPDSSRFWPANEYVPGKSQKSFDKQFVRDYLYSINWDKNPPAPELPDQIVNNIKLRYEEVQKISSN